MTTEDLIQTQIKVNSFAKSSLDHPSEFWAPPLAPTDMPLQQETLGPANRAILTRGSGSDGFADARAPS
jgi:hypothetical protein